jgi:lipoprotein-anchoring transpeptidase ErfK/SrfK
VLAAGIGVVAFASPGSHASLVSADSPAQRSIQGRGADAAPSIQVLSVTPEAGTQSVNGTSPVKVQFSEPLAANSPLPTFSPSIAGSWAVSGDTAVFTPAVGWTQNTKVTLTIPGGLAGVVSAAGQQAGDGGTLTSTLSKSFTTASFSTLRLQQLLSQLGYLPLTWTSTSGTDISASDAKAQLAAAYSAPAGSFSWQSGYPWQLTDQWKAGSSNILNVGAIRAFESVSGLTMDGEASATVWSDLFAAAAKDKTNPNGYTYALASQVIPERLKIWHDGKLVLETAANTGISDAPTVDGTFPVYLKYVFSYMKGTNPDGTPYDDPVWYASYFNGGDAVHEFDRPGYGYNQSLGCVEIPMDEAKQAYPYLTYGSLVTVTGPVGA